MQHNCACLEPWYKGTSWQVQQAQWLSQWPRLTKRKTDKQPGSCHKLTMRSTKGFLVTTSGGRPRDEGEEGELEADAELASDLELVRHVKGRHLEWPWSWPCPWSWPWGCSNPWDWDPEGGGRAWEAALDMMRKEGEEEEAMLCMRLGTLTLLALDI